MRLVPNANEDFRVKRKRDQVMTIRFPYLALRLSAGSPWRRSSIGTLGLRIIVGHNGDPWKRIASSFQRLGPLH